MQLLTLALGFGDAGDAVFGQCSHQVRKLHRQNREGVPTIGIVGYTNAGPMPGTALMPSMLHGSGGRGFDSRPVQSQALDVSG